MRGPGRLWWPAIMCVGCTVMVQDAGLPKVRVPPTPDPAAELWAQARPHLEQVLEKKLSQTPEIVGVTPVQMSLTPDVEVAICVRWLFPQLKEDGQDQAVAAARRTLALADLARYDEVSNCLYVALAPVPKTAAETGPAWKWDIPENALDLVQLALVHETARHVLNQRYDLIRRLKECKDPETFFALQGVWEGRAQWLTREVARRLGKEAVFDKWAERYRGIPFNQLDPISQGVLRQKYYAGVHGLAFFNYLEEKGMSEKAAFARLPRQMEVKQPELYVQSIQAPQSDLVGILTRLETMLPAKHWQPVKLAWTPDKVAQAAASLGEKDRAEKILPGWVEGKSLAWMRRKVPGQHVAVGLIRFDSADTAQAYFHFALDLQRKMDEISTHPLSGLPQTTEFHVIARKWSGVDEARWNVRRTKVPGQAHIIPTATLLARKGERVIEITWHNLAAEKDGDFAERVLAEAAK